MQMLFVDDASAKLSGALPFLEGSELALKKQVHNLGVLLDLSLPLEAFISWSALLSALVDLSTVTLLDRKSFVTVIHSLVIP